MSFGLALLSWISWPVEAVNSVCALPLAEGSACAFSLVWLVTTSWLATSSTITSGSWTTNTDCSDKPNMPPTFLAAVTLTFSL